MSKLYNYSKLTRLDKPIGIFLLLWPTLTALVIASNGFPDTILLIIFILGVIVMRSAGCIANDLADTKFDGLVARTKSRPLVSGALTKKQAVVCLLLLLLFAFILDLQLNLYTIILSFIALLLAMCYPFMKRITHYPQVILGGAFSMSILMAFSATNNTIPIAAFVLFFANICWTVAFDTQYALADIKDDLKIGVKSTAIVFGKHAKKMVFCLQVLAILSYIYIGIYYRYSSVYYFYLALAFIFVIYQQILIKDTDPIKCHKAFLNNNYFGMLLFFGIYSQKVNLFLV